MKEKLKLMSDGELLQLAHEMTLTSLSEDALVRTLVPDLSIFSLSIIGINCELAQVLAERLKCCSPHLEKT